jgi:hypothetical protein
MNDAELLGRLADIFERFDPVPTGIGRAAVLAGRLAGSPHTALALVADGVPGAVRGGGRLLGFAGPGGRVDVQVDVDDAGVVLTGQIIAAGALWVRWPDGSAPVDVDPWGRFTVSGLPAGPLSLVLRATGQHDAVGPWFVG